MSAGVGPWVREERSAKKQDSKSVRLREEIWIMGDGWLVELVASAMVVNVTGLSDSVSFAVVL